MRRLGRRRQLASRRSSASGPNGAKPHHRPGRPAASARATSSCIDFGALVDGYCSDMTRTVMRRRADRRPSSGCSTSSPRRRPRASRAVARRRRRRATVDAACRERHRRRRLGRRVPPRHRPRRGPRDPRGPEGGVGRRLLRSPPATSSPSSRASTSPSTAASASRTPSSSPPTGAAPLTHAPKS